MPRHPLTDGETLRRPDRAHRARRPRRGRPSRNRTTSTGALPASYGPSHGARRRARHVGRERGRLRGRRRSAGRALLARTRGPTIVVSDEVGMSAARGRPRSGGQLRTRSVDSQQPRRRRGCGPVLLGRRRPHARAGTALMRDALALLTTFGRRGGRLAPHAVRPTRRGSPLVGAVLGGVVGATMVARRRTAAVAVAAALVLAVNVACTGLLHVDGLADAADGFLAQGDRARGSRSCAARASVRSVCSGGCDTIVLQAVALASLPLRSWCSSRRVLVRVAVRSSPCSALAWCRMPVTRDRRHR